MNQRFSRDIFRVAALLTLSALLLFLCGCAKATHQDTVMYFDEDSTLYPEVLRGILPAHEIQSTFESGFLVS